MTSLSASLHKSPPKRDRAYTYTAETADVLGGGRVGVAKNAPKKGEAEDFLTYESGLTQQSCPLRAVAQAIASDILPLSEIMTILVDAKRVTRAQADKLVEVGKAA